MTIAEVSPNLKPTKHGWYTAVFVVMAVVLLVEIAQCLMDRPPEYGSAMDGLEYLFYLLGRIFVTLAVGAFLFFFDGWISKAIAICLRPAERASRRLSSLPKALQNDDDHRPAR